MNVTNINKMKIALLGATALLASTAAHAQVADTWAINGNAGPVSITAINTADVNMNSADVVDGTAGAIITDGQKNSVSASALGASAGASFTVTSQADSSLTAGVFGVDSTVVVSANSNANVANFGDITDASIAGGASNSISRVALGASGSVNASVTNISGDNSSSYTVPVLTVSAANGLINDGTSDLAATVSNGVNISTTDLSGNSNSVSAAAIGSSASIGASTLILDGSETGTFNFGVANDLPGDPTGATVAPAAITVLSTNTSNVVIANSSNDFTDLTALEKGTISANIVSGSNSDSVSASAIGASAGVSYSASVYGGDLNNTANFGVVVADDGTTTATDTFTITAVNGTDATDLTGATPLAIDAQPVLINATDITTAQIGDDSSNNSISVAGIGASASYSFAVNDYSAGGSGIVNNINAAAPTMLALNGAAVTVNSTFAAPQIDGGVNNSVSAAAIGASASQAFTLFTR